jgi:hypothetical protein
MTAVFPDGMPSRLVVSDISEQRNISNFRVKQPKKSFALEYLALKM